MASFPTSNPSNSTLWVAVNFLSNTLDGNHDNSTNVITILDTTGFPSAGYIVIDTEVIKYTGTTATTFTGCTRGSDGSSADTHSSGATVYCNNNADYHNATKDEVIAIATNLTNRIGGHATQNQAPNGTVTNPSWSFQDDTNCGLYRIGADNIGFAVGGAKVIDIGAAAISFGGTLASDTDNTDDLGTTSIGWSQIFMNDGTVTNPSFTFSDDPNCGLYRIGADNWALGAGATKIVELKTTTAAFLNGTVTNPGISFANASTVGIFSPSVSAIGLAVPTNGNIYYYVGTTEVIRFDGGGQAFTSDQASKTVDVGTAVKAFDDVYADDFQNVADIPFLDKVIDIDGKEIDVDDVAVIKGIKPKKDEKGRTVFSDNGHAVWDDNSLPEWIYSRQKDNKTKRRDASKIARSELGEPYISLKTLCALALGGIRQLESRVKALEE